MHIDIDVVRLFDLLFKLTAATPRDKRMRRMGDAFNDFAYIPSLKPLAKDKGFGNTILSRSTRILIRALSKLGKEPFITMMTSSLPSLISPIPSK